MTQQIKPILRLALVVMVAAVIGLGGAVSMATAHPYLNSSEAGCDGSDPAVILCDDFERGRWAVKINDGVSAQNDGWLITWVAGDNGATPWATCGSAGALGTNCAAVAIGTSGGDGGGWVRGEHGYGPTPDQGAGGPITNWSRYREVWMRFYFKQSTNYVYNSSQKFITIGDATVGAGGIDIAGIGRNTNIMEACPAYDCNLANGGTGYPNPCAFGGQRGYINQNQGVNIDLSTMRGHWIFIEIHVKLNTYTGSTPNQDGEYDLWLNDCGTNGLGCGGTPTRRAHYSPSAGAGCGVRWNGDETANCGSPSCRRIGKFFADFWGNPSDGGTIWWDQLKVKTSGPIGFAARR